MAQRINNADGRLFCELFEEFDSSQLVRYHLKRRVGEWDMFKSGAGLDIFFSSSTRRRFEEEVSAQMGRKSKLSLQPFQAETYPVTDELVKRIAAYFAQVEFVFVD
jgi:hypothetical protein